MTAVLQHLFTNVALRKFLFKTRYFWVLLFVLPLARFMNLRWLPAAVVISLFGQLIQAWCFGSLVKNRELSVRGPYLLVRNPMYLGRFFLILGFVCLLDRPLATVVYTVLYFPYMYYRVRREERRLERYYAEEFGRYCREVRRFLPSLRRIGDPAVRFFDMGMFLENHGHWNILLTLALYVAVYVTHVFFVS